MTYVSIMNKDSKTTLEIIAWYSATFEYNRITTSSKMAKWNNDYHTLCTNDIVSIQHSAIHGPPPGYSKEHNLRFLFKTIEDKTLFDLTWE